MDCKYQVKSRAAPIESNRGCYYCFYWADSRQPGQESAMDRSTRAAADPSVWGENEDQGRKSRDKNAGKSLCLSVGASKSGYRGMEVSRGGAIIR